MRVALVGGDAAVRSALAQALAGTEAHLLEGAGVAGADVALVAGDGTATAEERCAALAGAVPCVLLHDRLLASSPGRAAAAGARAVATLPPAADELLAACRRALAAPDARRRGGALLAVLAGAGGQGASTVALALARSLGGGVALLDLDLAGGSLGPRLGIAADPLDAGLAGEERGEEAYGRLARAVDLGHLVPAPPRPDLAWLVRDGVVSGLCRAACAANACVVADVGRPLGPTAEALLAADLLVVVTRLEDDALAAARRQLDLLARLALPAERVVVVANAVRRRDAVRLHGIAGVLGREVDASVAEGEPDGDEVVRALAAIAGRVHGLRGAA